LFQICKTRQPSGVCGDIAVFERAASSYDGALGGMRQASGRRRQPDDSAASAADDAPGLCAEIDSDVLHPGWTLLRRNQWSAHFQCLTGQGRAPKWLQIRTMNEDGDSDETGDTKGSENVTPFVIS
jgi:hypothetical protein